LRTSLPRVVPEVSRMLPARIGPVKVVLPIVGSFAQ